MAANNVIRLLTQRKISHDVFTLDTDHKSSAIETAERLGVPQEIVFKTIVIKPPHPAKPLLAVIPAAHRADLKAIAALLGYKKVQLPTQAEAERLTGLQAGGISPLALLNKGFSVIIDQSAEQHERIHISGGQRGLNIRLPVSDLIRLTNARSGNISNPDIQPFLPTNPV